MKQFVFFPSSTTCWLHSTVSAQLYQRHGRNLQDTRALGRPQHSRGSTNLIIDRTFMLDILGIDEIDLKSRLGIVAKKTTSWPGGRQVVKMQLDQPRLGTWAYGSPHHASYNLTFFSSSAIPLGINIWYCSPGSAVCVCAVQGNL